MDPQECLEGLRRAYYIAQQSSSEDDETIEMDEHVLRQIKKVEADLMCLLDDASSDALDDDERRERLVQTSERAAKILSDHQQQQQQHAYPCSDTHKALPSPPNTWPQAPVLIRPTPNSSTNIKGVRKISSRHYQDFPGFCAGCILPINNGSEKRGESIVVDFESTHFEGSMLFRLQQAPPLSQSTTSYNEDGRSYFDGKKRKFQAVVQGKFKTPLPMSETVTGQSFTRAAGKLPARWIVTSFITFISSLVPQLQVKLDGDAPRFLSPLVATAHTVLQSDEDTEDDTTSSFSIEDELEESHMSESSSVLSSAYKVLGITAQGPDQAPKASIAARMKTRKRLFNNLTAKKDTNVKFDVSKLYTFEFYQHLLDFGEGGLAVDMGRPIGKVGIAKATDGQPLKFMSAYQCPDTGVLDSLWSFDIWHASLYPYAQAAEGGE